MIYTYCFDVINSLTHCKCHDVQRKAQIVSSRPNFVHLCLATNYLLDYFNVYMTHFLQFKYIFMKTPSVGRRHRHVPNFNFNFTIFYNY